MTSAVQELADRGYDGTSLTRVAERAGVSKGLLWHYFAGKDDLMEATARATIATVHRPHRALGQPAVDCSTSISRSSDLCSVSGTPSLRLSPGLTTRRA